MNDEHCEKCWVTEIATENEGEYMSINPPFCSNPFCPCHSAKVPMTEVMKQVDKQVGRAVKRLGSEVPKDSMFERFDKEFYYHGEYVEEPRENIKSFFRKEIERAIEKAEKKKLIEAGFSPEGLHHKQLYNKGISDTVASLKESLLD